MKFDRFLLLTIGALAVMIIIGMLLGAAFFCTVCNNVMKYGPAFEYGGLEEYDNIKVINKDYNFNGSLAGYNNVQLEVHNINGKVTIKEGSTDEYKIMVDASGTERDFVIMDILFDESASGETKKLKMFVEKKEPNKVYSLSSKFQTEITIILPGNKTYSDMQIYTVNGNIDLADFSGNELVMNIVNGNIYSRFNADNYDLNMVNGNIDISTLKTQGTITANTVNGNINLKLPKNTQFKIDTASINPGAVSIIDIPMKYDEKSRFSVKGQTAGYAGTGFDINMNTVNGRIDIEYV
jgi:DUF4097 and DUF4098 domain-containing protein YvlB